MDNKIINKKLNINKSLKNNKNGFTLIEILAVIIIIGIIAIIAIPSISKYLNSSKDSTYSSYERSMEAAAKNRIIDCLANNEHCEMPEDEEEQKIYLDTLIEEGYLDNMKDPETKNFCEQLVSYVSIKGSSAGNYKYKACLYCGDYYTDDSSCVQRDGSDDGDNPICGNPNGDSTRWTNENRTVTVGCSDESSGCLQTVFSKTFTKTTKFGIGKVTIRDKSGNYTECEVNAYVDKTLPTCNIQVEGNKIESVGWYSMQATGKIQNMKDGDIEEGRQTESGLLTYGIGTSIKNREYNKKESITVGSGITTIIGYVKDVAGNEGICAEDVKVGTEQPKFNLYYGFKIYPGSEPYILDGLTKNGSKLTTGGSQAAKTIKISKTIKYKNVEKVKITLNSAIETTTTATLKVGNVTKSGLMQQGSKEILFVLKGEEIRAYDTYEIKLGELPNKEYNVNKIELLTKDGSIWSDQDITLYVEPDDAGLKTTEVSFANGETGTWTTTFQKTYTSLTENKIVTRNRIGMTSIEVPYTVRIDKELPTVTVTAVKTTSRTPVQNNGWSNEPLEFKLAPGVTGLSKQSLYYCVDTTNLCEPNIEVEANAPINIPNTTNYYFKYKVVNEVGVDNGASSFVAKFDLVKPVCEITNYATLVCIDSGEENYISGINSWYYNTVNSSSGQYAIIPVTRNMNTVATQRITSEGTYYLYVKDLAGNISDVKSTTYYKVIYDKNGGTTTPTKTSDFVREGQDADLTPTSTKTGHAFAGWHTDPNASIGLRTYQVNNSVTLYAIWLDLWASSLEYDDSSTGLGCSDVQCALDRISQKLK